MNIHIYICMCICMYTYIYEYICIYMYTYTHIFMYIYIIIRRAMRGGDLNCNMYICQNFICVLVPITGLLVEWYQYTRCKIQMLVKILIQSSSTSGTHTNTHTHKHTHTPISAGTASVMREESCHTFACLVMILIQRSSDSVRVCVYACVCRTCVCLYAL